MGPRGCGPAPNRLNAGNKLGYTDSMNPLTHLALLAIGLNGSPARMPVNPAKVLQQPFLSQARSWGQPLPDDGKGGKRMRWKQTWFGQSGVLTGYLLTDDDKLQSITLSTPGCEALEAALHQDLGEPYEQGTSPQFLFSTRYARWNIQGIEFVLEDFTPGCEVAIYHYQPEGLPPG